MILIAGLGNPGKNYEKTRHNVGFRALDAMKKKYGFSQWRRDSASAALVAGGVIEDKKIMLAKPQTFMNNSGLAVKKLMARIKAPASNLWVIHDEIDLKIGKIKVIKNRGAAGHKGVESIARELKTNNFVRFRIGIRPKNETLKYATGFVINKFGKDEEQVVKLAVAKTIMAIDASCRKGLEAAMTEYNR